MSEKYSATARVTLTLEVSVGSSWGEDCTVKQVHDQAAEEALGFVGKLVADHKDRIRFIGEPAVMAVFATRKGW